MNHEQLLKAVEKQLAPTEKEKKEMESFSNMLIETAKQFREIRPLLCGSAAKGTWLPKKNEVDLFLLFDQKTERKVLEKKGLSIAKSIVKKLKGKYKLAYAEHPYISAEIGKFDVDIVPCFDIADPGKIQSAVDRTPHHVKFIMENMKEEMKNQVRLLKQFCKANECYGADLKMQGFSGYLCEILILKHENFFNLIKSAAEWNAGIYFNFNSQAGKTNSPLVFIDPVDPNRNVAAAVSSETFFKFIKACRLFLKRPSESFFFPAKKIPLSLSQINKIINERGTRFLAIEFSRPNALEDILWSQTRKCLSALERILKENDFIALRKDAYIGEKCILVFEMERWKVPLVMKHTGPNIYSSQAKQFLSHYKGKNVFIENESWVVERKRSCMRITNLLEGLFRKSEKGLLLEGIPSKIAKEIKKSKIYYKTDFPKLLGRTGPEFRAFLKDYFEKNLNV